ncbi:MAG: hypothetical protein ACR2G2_17655 [Pseudonocardia sp.]
MSAVIAGVLLEQAMPTVATERGHNLRRDGDQAVAGIDVSAGWRS